MKKSGENIIIGIDHGYGYIKTASENIIKSGEAVKNLVSMDFRLS